MTSEKNNIRDYILFQIHRNIVSLYKRYLNIIEDLQEEHINMLNKLNKKIDTETLKSIDYFDENKYNYFRKRVLDLGNETLREIDKNFEFLDLNVKNEKK
jgi:hypothetical protein